MPDGASTAHLYRPKLLTVLREGYDVSNLRADVAAGLSTLQKAMRAALRS